MLRRFILILIVAGLFVPTIFLRQDLYDTLTPLDPANPVSDPSYRTLTTLATVMAHEWYEQSPMRFKFRLTTAPPSPDVNCCALYSSYPPAFLAPLYLASLVNRAPLALHQVMNMGLGYHLVLALLTALFAIFLADRSGLTPWESLIPAVASGTMMLYLPGPLLFLQTAWWPDTVVLLPFLLAVWLECVPRRGPLQLAVLLFGLLTDWLFFPLIGLLLLKRFLYGELHLRHGSDNSKGILATWAVGITLISAFVIASTGTLRSTIEKFGERSGLDGVSSPVTELTRFWENAITTQISTSGFFLLSFLCAISLTFLGLRRKIIAMDTMAIFFATICIHTIIVNRHSGPHIYSALKLSIPLSLAPVFFLSVPGLGARWRLPVAIVSTIACLAYLYSVQPLFKEMWGKNRSLPLAAVAQAKFIGQHTKKDQVVFSPNLLIDPLLPFSEDSYSAEAVALSMKTVNRARTITEVRHFIERKNREQSLLMEPGNYAVAVSGVKSDKLMHDYWRELQAKDAPQVENEDFYYFIVDRRFYLAK